MITRLKLWVGCEPYGYDIDKPNEDSYADYLVWENVDAITTKPAADTPTTDGYIKVITR